MASVVILLGSNMGNPMNQLQTAKQKLVAALGHLEKESSVYKTQAWGNTEQADFYNQVIVINTALTAQQCITLILKIELIMGRIRKEKWAERLIDIDILFYDGQILTEENLIIPHPYLQNRRFTLVPLCEIMPEFVHPILHKTMHTLLIDCKDDLGVIKINT